MKHGQVGQPEDLRDRTKAFALSILQMVDHLPNTVKGRAIAGQITRSATSVAANYRAARRARSPREFIAKLGIVEEEADETALWLELIRGDGMLPPNQLNPLPDEAQQLVAIIVASIRTVKSRHPPKPR